MEVSALINLVLWVVGIGIVYYIISLLLDKMPMDAGFRQIANAIILVICVLIILAKALPIIGVSI